MPDEHIQIGSFRFSREPDGYVRITRTGDADETSIGPERWNDVVSWLSRKPTATPPPAPTQRFTLEVRPED